MNVFRDFTCIQPANWQDMLNFFSDSFEKATGLSRDFLVPYAVEDNTLKFEQYLATVSDHNHHNTIKVCVSGHRGAHYLNSINETFLRPNSVDEILPLRLAVSVGVGIATLMFAIDDLDEAVTSVTAKLDSKQYDAREAVAKHAMSLKAVSPLTNTKNFIAFLQEERELRPEIRTMISGILNLAFSEDSVFVEFYKGIPRAMN